uniref:Uncharacterized protein n=1 Tax=Octopus bimaculoides TaxID=37653 RepID=A0A0L8HAK9_OCTBM
MTVTSTIPCHLHHPMFGHIILIFQEKLSQNNTIQHEALEVKRLMKKKLKSNKVFRQSKKTVR